MVGALPASSCEQFRERGGLSHLHSFYDEEVRIPGFTIGGACALDENKRELIRCASRRTGRDVGEFFAFRFCREPHTRGLRWLGGGVLAAHEAIGQQKRRYGRSRRLELRRARSSQEP